MLDAILGWFVLAIPFLVSLVAILLAIKVPPERHFFKFLWGLLALGMAFSGIAYWQQRRALGAADKSQSDAVSGVRESVKQEDQRVIDTLNATIGKLTEAVSGQQSMLNDIHGSNIVTGQKPLEVVVKNPPQPTPTPTPTPQPQQSAEQPLDIHVASLPAPSDPKRGKNAVQFVLTTNKTMNGGNVRIHCTNTFKSVSANISGASVLLAGGGGQVDDHTYESGISSPNWSPRMPLVLTVYFDDADLGRCDFTPLQ